MPEVEDFKNLDSVIESIRDEFDLAGVSLAVVRDDRLVYTQAYGYSDRENSIHAKTDNIFRIASVSKLITAVTIFWLIENGEISLEEKVFGDGGILGNDFGIPGNFVDQITVRHLLEYGSGLSSGSGANTINARVERNLTNPPGTNYVYNNIDYQILGRIIEQISKKNEENLNYENFVKKHILSFCDIENMAIRRDQRMENEVQYYTPTGLISNPSMANSDASAGWAGSATDLARLLVRINNNPIVEDILSSTYTSYTQSQAAAGIQNRPPFIYDRWIYYGDMAGTRAVVHKMDERTGYVLLINTSISNNFLYYARLFNIDTAIRNVTVWPSHDKF